MIFSGALSAMDIMDQKGMESHVKKIAQSAKGENGVVEFQYNNVAMYLISDSTHDRMRIVAPIMEYQKVTRHQLDKVMESNYHKALDARYAVSDGVLFSVYIHPLSSLTQKQLDSAVHQVSYLALTFGSDYTSGVLSFGGE